MGTKTSNAELASIADIVLVFTPRGDDVVDVIPEASRTGQLWTDDTHPQMGTAARNALSSRGVEITKLVCTDRSLSMTPALPGFHRGWLPGCLVTAIMVALQPEDRR